MKPKTTILLLLVLVIAGVAALLLPPSRTPPRVPDQSNEAKPLFASDQLGPSVAGIRLFVKTNKQPDLVLIKKNSRWWVSQPHLFPAHRSAIDNFLATLAQMTAKPINQEDTNDRDGEFHGRGLILEYTDRPPIRLSLGDRIGAGRARIGPGLELDFPDLIAETDTTLHDYFDALVPASFYAKKIEAPIMPDVDRIEFARIDGHQSSLVQRGGAWLIDHDKTVERALAQDLPDTPGIQQLFALFDLLELSEPQPLGTALSAYGLEQPLASITLGPIPNAPIQAGEAMTISLGVPADPEGTLRYVGVIYDSASPPAVFAAPTKYALLLAQDAINFRDPRIVATPVSLIASIDLKFGEGTFEWIELPPNKPPIFHRLNSEQVTIPSDHATDFLRALTQTQALAYLPLKLGEGDVWVSATIVPRLGGKPEPLTVYDDPASTKETPTMLVRRGTESIVLRVPRASVKGLFDPSTLVAEQSD